VPEHHRIGKTVFGGTDCRVHFNEDAGIASRYPIESVEVMRDETGLSDVAVRCGVITPAGPLALIALHLQTPRRGIEAVLNRGHGGIPVMREDTQERRRESLRAAAWAVGAAAGAAVIAADHFNLPTNKTIYQGARAGHFTDAFDAVGFGYDYTKHTRLFSARIDHVLARPGWHVESCRVGPDVGYDHRLVIVDVRWAEGTAS
jgi:endonuclease/exonuclease/phosphatase family metal-dependent hydrolase